MSRAVIDLSSRPFVNRRPVVRLSLLLWLAGALLLAGNVWLYWDFIAGRGGLHAQLRDLTEKIEIEERRISSLSDELSSFDLAAQNEQVVYLNQRIAQRRFSWSQLFDELADLLPREVRLTSLAPSTGVEGGGRRRRFTRPAGAREGDVVLSIEAEAENDQAILDFVDALFADPDFARPNLMQQRRDRDGGVISFTLEVVYAPRESALDSDMIRAEDGGVQVDAESADAESDAETAAPENGSTRNRPTGMGRPASSPPELS